VSRQRGLRPDSVDEPAREVDELRGRAVVRIAAPGERVLAESRPDLPREPVRPRAEAVDGVVGAPLDRLHPVQVRRHAAQRHVEHGDAPSGPTEMIPERLALHEVAGSTAVDLVGAGPNLAQAVDAVLGR